MLMLIEVLYFVNISGEISTVICIYILGQSDNFNVIPIKTFQLQKKSPIL